MFKTPGLCNRLTSILTIGLMAVAITSCVQTPLPPVTAVPLPGVALHGMVHGGQQPVKNSTVQLYAVGSAGDGSAATPLLSHTVLTDGGGNFDITGLYTCPSSSALVYLVSIGGDPGMGANNPNLAEMVALGPCGSLSASTFIVITEVTTAASVYELAPYMNSYSAIGYGSDLTGITGAFAEVNELVNISTGTAPGTGLPAGQGVPVQQINTLADILASCVNSAGGTAGDSTVCGRLLTYTGVSGAGNTIAAMLQIARNPDQNTSNLYSLISPNSPFQPVLTSAPATWNIAPAPFAAAPAISPPGGSYSATQIVTISDSTAGATIYYTTDGSTPTTSSTLYTAPIVVSASETLTAIAVATGGIPSPTATASYVIASNSPAGIISTYAGNGNFGSTGDGGQATDATLEIPFGVGVDQSGNLYIADLIASLIRKVTPAGIISTVAGNGTAGYSGDGGPATSASIQSPLAVTVDSTGNIYFVDGSGAYVRMVNPAGIITTIAGRSHDYGANLGDGGPATAATINAQAIAVDAAGNLYIAELSPLSASGRIRKVTPDGTISTVAGNGALDGAGDGGPAVNASLFYPYGIAVDAAGNLFFTETYPDGTRNHVREVTVAGTISTIAGAGIGTAGYTGDGGPAIGAQLSSPNGIAVDAAGNLYVTDSGNFVIRMITPAGIISTIAGNGVSGFSGDGGPATSASIAPAAGVAVDTIGNLFIADGANSRVRRVTLGVPKPVAAPPTFSPAGGTFTSSQTVTLSSSTSGASIFYTTDGSAPTTASTQYTAPITVSTSQTIRAVAAETGYTSSAISSASYTIGGPASTPSFSLPSGTYNPPQAISISSATPGAVIHYTTDGSTPTAASAVYSAPIPLTGSETIQAIATASGYSDSAVASAAYVLVATQASTPVLSPGAGTYNSDQTVTITSSQGANIVYAILSPSEVFPGGVIPNGRLIPYTGPIQIQTSEKIIAYATGGGYLDSPQIVASYAIDPTAIGLVTNIMQGSFNYTGEGIAARSALIEQTQGLAMDPQGNLYVSSASAGKVFKITPAGLLYTFAGNGNYPNSENNGDGGPAVNAAINPGGLAADGAGNIYIQAAGSVRRVAPDGIISTVVPYGALGNIIAIATDTSNNLYIGYPYTVQKMTPAGVVTTVAGSGNDGNTGDGGLATSATLDVYGLTVDASGSLYVADTKHGVVRKVTTDGHISTIAGQPGNTNTYNNYSGDGGPATMAGINPYGLVVDQNNNLYIADAGNNRIRKVKSDGTIITAAGGGTDGSDGAPALSAQLPSAYALVADPSGNLYVVGSSYNYLKKITFNESAQVPTGFPTFSPASGTYSTTQYVTIQSEDFGSTIFYTTDGSIPTTASKQFLGGTIPVPASTTIFAFAASNGRANSPLVSATYTITGTPTTAAPAFAPGAGTYATPTTISLSSSTAGASIFFTLDGSTPTISSTRYTGPFTISASATVQAIAVASGSSPSAVSSAAFVIDPNAGIGIITTAAGTGPGSAGFGGDGGPATAAAINFPTGVAVDRFNTVYIADTQNNAVRAFTPGGAISTVAGNRTQGYSGDGGTATSATLYSPSGVAADSNGNLYIADAGNNVIRKRSAAGTITTYAGNGNQGYSGDGGAATSASLTYPTGVVADAAGNLYIADYQNNVVREVLPNGTIATVAGNGSQGFSGDGGSAVSASLNLPGGVAIDSSNNLYIADTANSVIRKVSNGVISTFAGGGQDPTSLGDGGPALGAFLGYPTAVAVDNAGNLYITDAATNLVRKVTPAGIISTVAGDGLADFQGDGGPALQAALNEPQGVAVDQTGRIFIADTANNRIRQVAFGAGASNAKTATAPTISPGTGTYDFNQLVTMTTTTPSASIYYTVDGSTPTSASSLYTGPFYASNYESLNPITLNIQAVAVADGYQSSIVTSALYTLTPPSVAVPSTPAFSPIGGLYNTAQNVTISSDALANGGSIFYTLDGSTPTVASLRYGGPIPVSSAVTIKSIATDSSFETTSALATASYSIGSPTAPGVITTVAGGNSDNVTNPATASQLLPQGQVTDQGGNLYVSDANTQAVWRIDAVTGALTRIADSTTNLFYAQPGQFSVPGALTLDGQGNLYIADQSTNIVFKASLAGPFPVANLFAVAGGGTNYGASGDGGPGYGVAFQIGGIAADTAGNLFIDDDQNDVIRKVDIYGIITTVAGNYNNATGDPGNGNPATSVALGYTNGIAVDQHDNLYIADTFYGVRKVDTQTGIITTIAGNGSANYTGDGGPATAAELYPSGLTLDSSGDLYISDSQNQVVRKIDATTGIITTAAGNGTGGSTGDGGQATSAELNDPATMSVDGSGNLYLFDLANFRIRKVTAGGQPSSVAGTPVITLLDNNLGTDGNGALISSTAVHFGVVSHTSGASIYYTTDGSTPTTASTLYTGPIALNPPGTTTIKAIATATADPASQIASATYTLVYPAGTVSFSPGSNTYTTIQPVSIATTTPGATIYYTTDGSYPTTSSARYTGPITVGISETVNAIAVKSGYADGVGYASYVINVPPAATPTLSLAAGPYMGTQTITLADTTPNATIYYTTDGSTPTISSAVYAGPITVGSSETISAIATAPGDIPSAVATATYTIHVSARNGVISTAAGNGVAGFSGDGGQGTSASLNGPSGTAFDSAGNMYIADAFNQRIRKVTPAGIISTVAGTGASGFYGDGGQATAALLSYPAGVTVDSAGNLYIVDSNSYRIRKVTPAGIITTVAGNGISVPNLSPGIATNTSLGNPSDVKVDAQGNLYIADIYLGLLKVTPSGLISVLANIQPHALAIDSTGNLYATMTYSQIVNKVTPAGVVTLFAGTGVEGDAGDGGPATSAQIDLPLGVAVDAQNNVYIQSGDTIKMVAPSGIITTEAGTGVNGYTGDGGPAPAATFRQPRNLAIDASGNLYIADLYNNVVRKVTFPSSNPPALAPIFSPAAGTYTSVQTVSVSSATPGAAIYYTTDGSTPTPSSTLYTSAINVAASETINAIAIASGYANSPVTSQTYTINLPAAPAPLLLPVGGTYTSAQTVTISSVGPTYYTLDGSTPTTSSTLYSHAITVSASETIKAITSGGSYSASPVTTATYVINLPAAARPSFSPAAGAIKAGQAIALSSPTTAASIYYTTDGSTPTTNSTLYTGPITITTAQTLHAIALSSSTSSSPVSSAPYTILSGTINTVAGNGSSGYGGDGGTATAASFNNPQGIAVDASGNLYIADTYNNRIRKVTPSGIVTTVAGTGTYGYSGDGGQAVNAKLAQPFGVAVDSAGNLYIADTYNNVVRWVTPAGVISTFSYTNTFSSPRGVTLDSAGNLYIWDSGNNQLLTLSLSSPGHWQGSSGAGNMPGQFHVGISYGLCGGQTGVTDCTFVSDPSGNKILNLYLGTFYGGGSSTDDGIAATSAYILNPQGLAGDGRGNLYFADGTNRVRIVNSAGIVNTLAGNHTVTFTGDGGPATSAGMNTPTSIALDASGNLYILDSGHNRIRKVTFQ